MNRCAFFSAGVPPLHSGKGGPVQHRPRARYGFTLLEMCMVLFIIVLMFGVVTPSVQMALTEQAVHNDAHQLAFAVRLAMLRSRVEHRPYVLDLTARSLALHPLEGGEEDAPVLFDGRNLLLAPDPKKARAWISMPATSWQFQPGELCPATRVRVTRGAAWMEMNFNALTGNVENETDYFP